MLACCWAVATPLNASIQTRAPISTAPYRGARQADKSFIQPPTRTRCNKAQERPNYNVVVTTLQSAPGDLFRWKSCRSGNLDAATGGIQAGAAVSAQVDTGS